MPIKLRNRGRVARTVELTSLGLREQTDVHVVRDPRTGSVGRAEVTRSFPAVSVFVPGRGESEELPDAAERDPAVMALRSVLEVVRSSPASPLPNPTTRAAQARKEQ